MLVQRLTQRLATLRSHLAARLRAMFASLRSAGRGAATGAIPHDGRLSTQQSGSWLDDAHRLRQRRSTALATADQNRGKQTISGEPRPAVPTRPILPPPAPATSTPPAEARPARPWQFPAHPAPAPSTPPQPAAAAPTSHDGDEAHARRRLMSLRYLVRIGLYNEGFAPSAVPEQYQRSLGTEDELDDEQQ